MIQFFKKYWSMAVLSLLSILFGLAIGTFWYQARIWPEILIAEHIEKLKEIFDDINNTAGIINFKNQYNLIDFLNVGSFEGSELGSMNLANPSKWQGPYLHENFTIQEKQYQVVRTNKGYFITPGNGVYLLNGKTIGKEIILDEYADIAPMLQDSSMLMYGDKPLGAPLSINSDILTPLIDTEGT